VVTGRRDPAGAATAALRTVVFDFANTLCSEHYFAPLGPAFLAVVQEAIFRGEGNARWCEPWIRGEVTSADIAVHLAGLTGLAAGAILAGLEEGCASLPLDPAVWACAQAQRGRGRRTALVTLNMDVFTRVVVPAHGFDRVFDVVVNSADHGVDDKLALCELALGRIEGGDFAGSLLIDDSETNVEAFRARGGLAYQYTCDEDFAVWSTRFGL
jgi:FMN phosphatase YigB (HAD superfamily)